MDEEIEDEDAPQAPTVQRRITPTKGSAGPAQCIRRAFGFPPVGHSG